MTFWECQGPVVGRLRVCVCCVCCVCVLCVCVVCVCVCVVCVAFVKSWPVTC